MLLLMDATEDSAKLLDNSLTIFDKKENHFSGIFVDGISKDHLHHVFENPSTINNEFSYKEILEKILHSEAGNSEDFIHSFVNKCEDLSLKVSVYLNNHSIDHDLLNDSLYSDLLLIGKNIFSHKKNNKHYNEIIELLLRNSKCPVFLVPNEIKPLENIILLFDGSEKSFEAIKLFSYLFETQLLKNKVILYTIMNDLSMEEEKNIYNYIKTHQQYFSVMRSFPETYYNDLKNLLTQFDNFILVTGVNRNEIIEDIIFNHDHSFFLEGNRSVFMI